MSRDAITFPFAINARAVVSSSARLDVMRQQIEQVLFTIPGERSGRPEFGCGVQRLVFSPADSQNAAATEYVISTALSRNMGDLISVDAVRARVDEASFYIDILFTALDDGEELHVEIAHPLEGPP